MGLVPGIRTGGDFPVCKIGRGVKLTTEHHLVPRLRMKTVHCYVCVWDLWRREGEYQEYPYEMTSVGGGEFGVCLYPRAGMWVHDYREQLITGTAVLDNTGL